ncbi:MAG: SxtJ family membrane protein [Candidatus Eremiobacteraeota bacterium]|nr:SxtJ family membrane protein [Candidatus Eremiobacteraeota bacterium]
MTARPQKTRSRIVSKNKPDTKILRSFGLLIGAIFLLLGLWQYWPEKSFTTASLVLFALGALLLIPGALFPAVLAPVYRGWMAVAHAMGWLMTRLILALVFFLIFTPAGLIMRLLGADLLKLRFERSAETYWITRPQKPFNKAECENPF